MEKDIVRIAIEYWQMYKLAESMLSEISTESARHKSSRINYLCRQFHRFLNEKNLQLIDYTHQAYEANLPVLVMNKDDIDTTKKLIISRTHEPTIMKNGVVYEMGKVFLEPEK